MAMGGLLENLIMAFGLFYNLMEKKAKRKTVLALVKEQTETLKKLIAVQDNERKRIAGDLHDNIGPLLAALKINFKRIIHTKQTYCRMGWWPKRNLLLVIQLLKFHNVAHNLMPKGISSNGLINTFQEYFESLQQLYNKTLYSIIKLNLFLILIFNLTYTGSFANWC